jgi:membrane protein implicated in regulation of membrane protease activity
VPYFPLTLTCLLTVASIATGIGVFGVWGDAIVPVFAGALFILLLASVLVLAIFLILLARTFDHTPHEKKRPDE